MDIKRDLFSPHIYIWKISSEELFSVLEKNKNIAILYPVVLNFLFESFNKFQLDTSRPEYHYLEYVKPIIRIEYKNTILEFELLDYSKNSKKYLLSTLKNEAKVFYINDSLNISEESRDDKLKCIRLYSCSYN